MKNVEREFTYSLNEYGEVYSKLLDEIREKWNKKADDGSWRAQRRLWEAYESVPPNGDVEEVNARLGRLLKYLKLHYRSRLNDHGKWRSRYIDHVIDSDPEDESDEQRSRFDDIGAKVGDPDTAAMMADLFERFREFIRENYKGARIDELIAVINAIENGAYKRRDIAADAGIDGTRLNTILRTLRELGTRWREQDPDAAPVIEILDQLDDDTETPTNDEDSE